MGAANGDGKRVMKQFKLPPELCVELEAAAAEGGSTMTAIVEDAIRLKLAKEGPRRMVPGPAKGAKMTREEGLAYGEARAAFFQQLPKSAFRSTMPTKGKHA